MSRNWVVDASPVILLAKIGQADLLPGCAEEFLIPEAVAEEVRAASKEDPARTWLEAKGHRLVERTASVDPTVAGWDLGRGESRVLSHSLRHPDWTAVVDDGAARHCAQALDISVVGTLGVLVVAKNAGFLKQIQPSVDALLQAGLHVDNAVVNQALRMADEL